MIHTAETFYKFHVLEMGISPTVKESILYAINEARIEAIKETEEKICWLVDTTWNRDAIDEAIKNILDQIK